MSDPSGLAAPRGAEPAKAWTILAVLDWTRAHFEAKGIQGARLDAEVILAHVLGIARVMLYARFDQPLGADELSRIRTLVARRARGEPVAHLLGEREFYSMAFEVTPDVLIPRPDTETLVEVAVKALAGRPAPVVADVGTGSGCVALAIANEVPAARVYGLERSEAALAVARRNSTKHGLDARVTMLASDLLAELPAEAGPLDLVVANLPYIPSPDVATLMRDVRDFEPRSALDGGDDGLDLIRLLIAEARSRLKPGGVIALEHGHDQSARVLELLAREGYRDGVAHRDLGDHARVAAAIWAGGA